MRSYLEDLSPQQKIFIRAFVDAKGKHGAQTTAARAAGYSEDTVHQIANNLMRNPKILRAIKEEVTRRYDSASVLALAVIMELAGGAADEAVRLKAAIALKEQAGHVAVKVQKHEHSLEDNRSDKELIDYAKGLVETLDPQTPGLGEIKKRLLSLDHKPDNVEAIDVESEPVDEMDNDQLEQELGDL